MYSILILFHHYQIKEYLNYNLNEDKEYHFLLKYFEREDEDIQVEEDATREQENQIDSIQQEIIQSMINFIQDVDRQQQQSKKNQPQENIQNDQQNQRNDQKIDDQLSNNIPKKQGFSTQVQNQCDLQEKSNQVRDIPLKGINENSQNIDQAQKVVEDQTIIIIENDFDQLMNQLKSLEENEFQIYEWRQIQFYDNYLQTNSNQQYNYIIIACKNENNMINLQMSILMNQSDVMIIQDSTFTIDNICLNFNNRLNIGSFFYISKTNQIMYEIKYLKLLDIKQIQSIIQNAIKLFDIIITLCIFDLKFKISSSKNTIFESYYIRSPQNKNPQLNAVNNQFPQSKLMDVQDKESTLNSQNYQNSQLEKRLEQIHPQILQLFKDIIQEFYKSEQQKQADKIRQKKIEELGQNIYDQLHKLYKDKIQEPCNDQQPNSSDKIRQKQIDDLLKQTYYKLNYLYRDNIQESCNFQQQKSQDEIRQQEIKKLGKNIHHQLEILYQDKRQESCNIQQQKSEDKNRLQQIDDLLKQLYYQLHQLVKLLKKIKKTQIKNLIYQIDDQINRLSENDYVDQGGFHKIYRIIISVGNSRLDLVVKTLSSNKLRTEIEFITKFLKNNYSKHIAQMYIKDNKYNYYLLKYYHFKCLRDYLKKYQFVMSLKRKLKILIQIAKGIQHLHSHNILHLDIKPDNILISKNGNVKICDFGEAYHPSYQFQRDQIKFSVPYGGPEAIQHKTDYLSSNCDVYSFGTLAYELLIGKLPQVKQKYQPAIHFVCAFRNIRCLCALSNPFMTI